MSVWKPASALLAFGVLWGIAWPSVVRADAGAQERPFQGTAEGTVTEIVTPTNWIIDYVGNATHLGRFTRREWITFNDDGTFQGSMTFVAADGDELDLVFSGFFVSPNDAVGTYTFTGGDGRFEDAAGTADFYAYTPDFLNVSVVFKGSISY